ncbi:hypothetical protein BLD44_028470 [Mastigocladus laminosus UU774]|nr:hypothetical protein BLD44_028470 [Mastigocladus laminosus UU774]
MTNIITTNESPSIQLPSFDQIYKVIDDGSTAIVFVTIVLLFLSRGWIERLLGTLDAIGRKHIEMLDALKTRVERGEDSIRELSEDVEKIQPMLLEINEGVKRIEISLKLK